MNQYRTNWSKGRKKTLCGTNYALISASDSPKELRQLNEKLRDQSRDLIHFNDLLERDYGQPTLRIALIRNPKVLRNLHHFLDLCEEAGQPITPTDLLYEIDGKKIIDWVCSDPNNLEYRLLQIFKKGRWVNHQHEVYSFIQAIPLDIRQKYDFDATLKGLEFINPLPVTINASLTPDACIAGILELQTDPSLTWRMLPMYLHQLTHNGSALTAQQWQTPMDKGETLQHLTVRLGFLSNMLAMMDQAGQPITAELLRDDSGDRVTLIEQAMIHDAKKTLQQLFQPDHWTGRVAELEAVLREVPARFAAEKADFLRDSAVLRKAALATLRCKRSPATAATRPATNAGDDADEIRRTHTRMLIDEPLAEHGR
ncbi:MAG: hypothetical protein K2Q12_05410 [Rickettsiales bacterium]|nr:hypothetical protein [Rickettsiales bacterium]